MISTSDAYKRWVATDHTKVFRMGIEQNGVTKPPVPISGGGVKVNRNELIRRTITATVPVTPENREYLIPGGAGDILAPISTILRPEIGVVIPVITRVSRLDDTQAQWAEGTLTDVVATPDGRLTLG